MLSVLIRERHILRQHHVNGLNVVGRWQGRKIGARLSSASCLSKRVERETTAEVRLGVEIGNQELLAEVCEICKWRYQGKRRLWELRGVWNLGDSCGLECKLGESLASAWYLRLWRWVLSRKGM